MQSVAEILELNSGSITLEEISTTNDLTREAGLLGRPLVSRAFDEVPVFQFDTKMNKFNQITTCSSGLIFGGFSGIHIIETSNIDQDGVSIEDSLTVLIRDTINKKTYYGLPINNRSEISAISDVMVDLRNNPTAQEIEEIVAQEDIDLFALAACYRGLSFKNSLEKAQFLTHAQFLFKPSDLCSYVSAQTVFDSDEPNSAFTQFAEMAYVSNDCLSTITFRDENVYLTFSEYLSSDVGNYEKHLILNDYFNAYKRPNNTHIFK